MIIDWHPQDPPKSGVLAWFTALLVVLVLFVLALFFAFGSASLYCFGFACPVAGCCGRPGLLLILLVGLENSEADIEESVSVERAGECLIIHFKCPCGKGYRILISGRNCYYKLM
ncbi:hypothetical protein LWI29_009395 [Acer saccharum]|uniref:Uncharacterized protein n=1 Tax=Acer saccharum TaxID=4024 RepID=A0AA39RDW0_ACESA|nr:hypothetical protein LWI29_009395 [Acer saccharum]